MRERSVVNVALGISMVAAAPQLVVSKESARGRGRCGRASRIVHGTSTLGVPIGGARLAATPAIHVHWDAPKRIVVDSFASCHGKLNPGQRLVRVSPGESKTRQNER